MHKLVINLESLLQELPFDKKKKTIQRVYQQIVPSPKTGKFKPGKYNDFITGGSDNYLELVDFVYHRLREYQLTDQAQRLKTHYSLADDWLKI